MNVLCLHAGMRYAYDISLFGLKTDQTQGEPLQQLKIFELAGTS